MVLAKTTAGVSGASSCCLRLESDQEVKKQQQQHQQQQNTKEELHQILVMSVRIKLQPDGICKACNQLALPADYCQCMGCNSNFHVLCTTLTTEEKLANKTSLSYHHKLGKNFPFLCNICLTRVEIILATEANPVNTTDANIPSNRIEALEVNMVDFGKELTAIKDILLNRANGV